MQFPDLTEYRYLGKADPSVLNVGWLDVAEPFPTGDVTPAELATLLRLAKEPVNRTRGWHRCGICGVNPPIVAGRSDDAVQLGDAEIRVVGCDGTIYAAPNLIYHYVEAHHYRPPDQFLKALSCKQSNAKNVEV